MKTHIVILILILTPLLHYGQECCSSFRSDGLDHYRAGQYEEAINNYLAALNCPDQESCPDLPNLIKQALNARVLELNRARENAEAATRRALANDIMYKAQNEEDRTTSFRLAELAWRIDPGNPKALAQLVETVYNRTGPWCDNFATNAPLKGPEGNLWILKKEEKILEYEGIPIEPTLSPENKYQITGDGSVWDLEAGKELYNLTRDKRYGPIQSVRFSPDGKHIIMECMWVGAYLSGNDIAWLDTETGNRVFSLSGGGYYELAFSEFLPDANYFVSGTHDQATVLRDAYSLKEVLTLKNHTSVPFSARSLPDGAHLLMTHSDGTAKIWEFSDPKWKLAAAPSAPDPSSPTGEYLTSAANDFLASARKWQTDRGFWNLFEQTGTGFDGNLSRDQKWRITLPGDQTAILWDAETGEKIWTLEGHTGPVIDARFLQDWIVTISEDQTIKIWDAASTGREKITLNGHSAPLTRLKVSWDRQYALTFSEDHLVNVWHLETGQLLYSYKDLPSPITPAPGTSAQAPFARFSEDGKFLVYSDSDHNAMVWKWWRGNGFLSLQGHTDEVVDMAFSTKQAWGAPASKEEWIATASKDHTAKVWNAATGQVQATFTGHHDQVNTVCLGEIAPVYAAPVSYSAPIPATYDTLRTIPQPYAPVTYPSPSTDTLRTIPQSYAPVTYPSPSSYDISFKIQALLTASDDHTAIVWNAMSGERLLTLQGHSDRVVDACFSPDGTRILTASDDRSVKIWDALTGKELHTLNGHLDRINNIGYGEIYVTSSLAAALHLPFTSEIKYGGSIQKLQAVVTASDDQTAILWNAMTGEKIWTLKGHNGKVKGGKFFSLAPDEQYVVTFSDDHTAKVWDVATGQEKYTLRGHTAPITAAELSLSSDIKYIATASADHTVKLWDANTGQLLHSFPADSAQVLALRFYSSGRYIGIATDDHVVQVWPVKPGPGHFAHVGLQLGTPLELEGRSAYGPSWGREELRFSPDEKQVFSISPPFGETLIKIWDVERRKEVFSMDGLFSSASFSPDGQYLLTISKDQIGEIIEISTKKSLRTLSNCNFLNISSDGKQVLAGNNTHVIVWDMKTGEDLFTWMKGDSEWVNPQSTGFSPSGRYVCIDTGGRLEVWDWRNSKKVLDHQFSIGGGSYEFSGDEQSFLTSESEYAGGGENFNYTSIKNLNTQKEFSISEAGFATFSPDGKSVLTTMNSSADGSCSAIKIWDMETQNELLSIPGDFKTARFSPDGKRILTTSREGPAKVWDATTGEEILAISEIVEKYDLPSFAQWSQDGKRILARSGNGMIKEYLISGEELISAATHTLQMGYFTPGQIAYYDLEAAFSDAGITLSNLVAAGVEEKIRTIAAYYVLQGNQISNREISRGYYEKAIPFYEAAIPIAQRYTPETYRMWIDRVKEKLEGLSGK